MATYALANIVSASDKPLSELIKPLKKYSQSGEINTKTVTPPAEILAKIKELYSAKAKVFELDGVSVDAWVRRAGRVAGRQTRRIRHLLAVRLRARACGDDRRAQEGQEAHRQGKGLTA